MNKGLRRWHWMLSPLGLAVSGPLPQPQHPAANGGPDRHLQVLAVDKLCVAAFLLSDKRLQMIDFACACSRYLALEPLVLSEGSGMKVISDAFISGNS